uniref:Pan3 C-terminal knob domain-containing protein n=1 Tax=Neobodo designis TaxID=312471 RepID=A0A7S1LCJ4_NEODS|mmetsp:Transcript_19189/g.59604  ORF Transcript_19189/g.59604 Transcript_19189/m.59604 type:complete len:529 (+) Transcript_19189:269-1855(+)
MSEGGFGKRRRRRGGGGTGPVGNQGQGQQQQQQHHGGNNNNHQGGGQQHHHQHQQQHQPQQHHTPASQQQQQQGGVSPPTMVQPAVPARDASKVFPMAPYVPVSNLTIQQQLREQLLAQPEKKGTTVVASAKFSHFLTISNLESEPAPSSLDPEYSSQVYHTTNRYSGKQVVLRRLVDPKISPDTCTAVFESLRHFRHPNLVPLDGVIWTTDFVLGHNDVIAEYRFHRGAKTLLSAFFGSPDQQQPPTQEVTEALLWSIACQLAGLIRTFHDAGVPLRGLHLTKILYLPVGQRVLFAGAGLKDLMSGGPAPKDSIEKSQRADVISLGLLLLKLATRNPTCISLEPLQKLTTVSPVLLHFITTCVDGTVKIEDLCRGLGERMSMEVGHQLGTADFLMQECAKEVHNGRLMKLLMKLNFAFAADISPDPEMIALRLLFQYLFHQVDENGAPRTDWGHVFFALNKLDTRSPDVVQLMSENDGTLLVISFADLRTLLDRAAASLVQKPDVSAPSQSMGTGVSGGSRTPGSMA